MAKIATHKDLRVYQLPFIKAMEIHAISKLFPIEEKYSLTD
ncbi:four helix bundle protein [Flavobacterium sp.]